MKRKYTYEDEKRDALASYLSDKPEFKEEWTNREVNIELMKIKTDLKLIGRLAIKNFRSKCDRIIERCANAK